MVQVGRIDRFQRSGVALAPVADQIAVQAARPANPALQKRETQPGKAPGYPVHEDGLAHGFAGGGKVADVVIHKVGDRGPQPDTRRGRMKAGRDTEFYTLGPHRVVVVLAIQPQGIVPLGVAAGLGCAFGYRRDRSALEAGQHGRLGAAVRGHKLQFFNRLLGRVHGNHRSRGQAVLQALELLGRIHIERAAGGPAHLLVAQKGGEQGAPGGIHDRKVQAQLAHPFVQQPGQHGRGPVPRILGRHPPPGRLQHPPLTALLAGQLSPLLIAKLVGDFLVALDNALAADLVQILHGRGFKLDPVTIGIDHRMRQTGVDTLG